MTLGDGPAPRSVARLGSVGLSASAALLAWYALNITSMYRGYHGRAVAAVLAGASIALVICVRLPPARRLGLAIAILPSLCLLHLAELVITLQRPGPATAAAHDGRVWDSRPMADVVHDLRAEGKDAWPSARPRLLYKRLHRGLLIAGKEALPLGGISRVTTVLCKESGSWATYDADEHGFNNPSGIWSRDVEIALVGDSYTQGACVPADQGLAARIRARHPGTLNVGMLGNGPLIELATLTELLPALHPGRVLWLYYHNDLSDLNLEKTSGLLRRYVDEDGFRVGLIGEQPIVDTALRAAISAIEGSREVAWWPRSLAAVGLTRRTTPVWLQDLVMREHNSSASAVLRLDHLLGLAFVGRDPEAPSARNPPDLALFERILERAKARTASWGGTLTFVYLPDFWGPDGKWDYPNREGVLAAAREAGLPMIDVHAAFRERDDVSRLRYFPESHCNGAGYAAIGDVILSALDVVDPANVAPAPQKAHPSQ